MEDLPLGRITGMVPEFAVKDLTLSRTHDDDDDPKIIYPFMDDDDIRA